VPRKESWTRHVSDPRMIHDSVTNDFVMLNLLRLISLIYFIGCELGSSVGIATDYGLDSLGSNSGGDEIFCPSRLVLGPTQAPVQWVFPGGKVRLGCAADHSPPSSAAVMEE